MHCIRLPTILTIYLLGLAQLSRAREQIKLDRELKVDISIYIIHYVFNKGNTIFSLNTGLNYTEG